METDLQTAVLTRRADVEALRPEWEALAVRVGCGFAGRPSYALPWWDALGRGELAVSVARRAGRLVGVAPLHRRVLLGQPVVRWTGHGLGTVGELVCEDAEAATAVWEGLADRGEPLQLVHVRLDDPGTLALRRSPRWDVRLVVADRCAGVRLAPGSRAADLRSARSLKRLAQYRRALEREGRPFTVEVVDDLDGLHRRWPDIQAVAAEADRERDREDLCGSPFDRFTLPFLEQEARAGNLLVVGGLVGGRWVAHEVALRTGRRLDLWLSRFDPALAQVGLGHLLAERLVDLHVELEVDALDFGIGHNAYKAVWADTGYDVGSLVALPVGGHGGRTRARLATAELVGSWTRRLRR
ncbi:MAG: family N-acetyltransferase [Frankiales bacterium]|nr:family N-acetyltransferase [Frankiales bacterium]